MLKHRVIPCLLLRDGALVKTRQFKNARYVGDPINTIRIFNEKEVDELMVLDINASREKREPNYELIENFASECFMPLCYGGGVRSVQQAGRLFRLGVEKICLQSAALENPELISELADRFGSQSIVISVDIAINWLKQTCLYDSRSRGKLKRSWLNFMKEAVTRGAGEVVINLVDRDGMMIGYDLEIIKEAADAVNVPLIVLGGAGDIAHFRQAIDAGASACAAGSMFIFMGKHRAVMINYPRYDELQRIMNNE